MFTWTSKTAILCATFFLVSCAGVFDGLNLGARSGRTNDASQIAVTADQIIIKGPQGFCVDPSSVRDTDDTGFVILGNCAAITQSRLAAQPDAPAILTAAISGPGTPGQVAANMDGMDAFFRSVEGRGVLSRDRSFESVTIFETLAENGVFYLRARDTSAAPVDGVQAEYWRAYMDMGRRIVTLSVLGLEGRELATPQGLNTLRGFVQAIRTANVGILSVEPAILDRDAGVASIRPSSGEIN